MNAHDMVCAVLEPKSGVQNSEDDPTESGLELFLSNDILQGEQRVPFYLLMKNLEIKRISLHTSRFRLVDLHNTKSFTRVRQGAIIEANDLKSKDYLGGVLSTRAFRSSDVIASLELRIELTDGSVREFVEKRHLFSVRAQLAQCPKEVTLPVDADAPPIKVRLSGKPTVTIAIDREPPGIELSIPSEVASVYQLYFASVQKGLLELKEDYPKYRRLVDKVLDEELSRSIAVYLREVKKEFEKAKNDEEFMQSLAYVFVSALLEQESYRNALLVPLMEYLESSTANKTFLESPFSGIKVPVGGARLRVKLTLHDLLLTECGEPIVIDVDAKSTKEAFVPLSTLIGFERS
jgi:hypothetical protein